MSDEREKTTLDLANGNIQLELGDLNNALKEIDSCYSLADEVEEKIKLLRKKVGDISSPYVGLKWVSNMIYRRIAELIGRKS